MSVVIQIAMHMFCALLLASLNSVHMQLPSPFSTVPLMPVHMTESMDKHMQL